MSGQESDELDASPRVVAATVKDVPVYADEVQRELRRVLTGRQADASALRFLQAKTLQQLIDRQLILVWLAEKRQAATDQDVRLAQTQLEKRLATREMTLTAYARRFRRIWSWERFWSRCSSPAGRMTSGCVHTL